RTGRPDAAAWQNLGVLSLRAGRLQEAREALEKAAALEPGPEADMNLAACALAQGRLDEAARLYGRLELVPGLAPRAMSRLAEIAARRGKPADAARLYESALSLDPY